MRIGRDVFVEKSLYYVRYVFKAIIYESVVI